MGRAGWENRDRVQAMLALRFSSAATRHVLKKHKGTRGAVKRRVIREQKDE